MSDPLSIFVHQVQRGDVVLAAAVGLLVACLLYRIVRLAGAPTDRPAVQRLANLAWHIGCLLGLEQAYEFTRGRIFHEKDITDIALLHAY